MKGRGLTKKELGEAMRHSGRTIGEIAITLKVPEHQVRHWFGVPEPGNTCPGIAIDYDKWSGCAGGEDCPNCHGKGLGYIMSFKTHAYIQQWMERAMGYFEYGNIGDAYKEVRAIKEALDLLEAV